MRLCVSVSEKSAEAHLRRLKQNLPPEGAVNVLMLTEKQFENRGALVDSGMHGGWNQGPGCTADLAF